MILTRRDFIRLFGLALASLALSRCGRFKPFANTPRGRLRHDWTQFDELADNVRLDVKLRPQNYGAGNKMAEDLLADHRAALDELVASGDLSTSTADALHEGYSAAVGHIWRSNVPISYEPMIVDDHPTSAEDLVNRSNALENIATISSLDPKTVATVQDAIENDLAFIALTDDEVQALYDRLIKAANEGAPVPPFGEMEFETRPEVAEAAQFLVQLFLVGYNHNAPCPSLV